MTPIKDDNDNGDEWPVQPPTFGETADDSGDWIELPPSFDETEHIMEEHGSAKNSVDELNADEQSNTDQWLCAEATPVIDRPEDASAETPVAVAAPPHEPVPAAREPPTMRLWSASLAVIAVVVIGLLALGGYALIRESKALQAELQYLQAQLEAAVPPADVLAERELRRTLMERSESLENELADMQLQYTRQEADLTEALAVLRAENAVLEKALQTARQPQPSVPVNTETQTLAARNRGGAGDWFVNFGSYGQRAIAQRWIERLDVAGGTVVLQEAAADGEPVYRVRIIGLETKSLADKLARALESEYQLPALWIGRD